MTTRDSEARGSLDLRTEIAATYAGTQVGLSPWDASMRLGIGHALTLRRPLRVEQILVNLAVNARDAMPGGGTLKISAHNELLKGEPEGLHGEHVALRLTDSGSGTAPNANTSAAQTFTITINALDPRPLGRGLIAEPSELAFGIVAGCERAARADSFITSPS